MSDTGIHFESFADNPQSIYDRTGRLLDSAPFGGVHTVGDGREDTTIIRTTTPDGLGISAIYEAIGRPSRVYGVTHGDDGSLAFGRTWEEGPMRVGGQRVSLQPTGMPAEFTFDVQIIEGGVFVPIRSGNMLDLNTEDRRFIDTVARWTGRAIDRVIEATDG